MAMQPGRECRRTIRLAEAPADVAGELIRRSDHAMLLRYYGVLAGMGPKRRDRCFLALRAFLLRVGQPQGSSLDDIEQALLQVFRKMQKRK